MISARSLNVVKLVEFFFEYASGLSIVVKNNSSGMLCDATVDCGPYRVEG